jgi:hypothetical protein
MVLHRVVVSRRDIYNIVSWYDLHKEERVACRHPSGAVHGEVLNRW